MVGRAINECLSHLILNVGIFLIGLFVDRFELSNTRFELLILVLESTTVPTVLLCSLLFLLITDDINYVFLSLVQLVFCILEIL